MSDHRHAMILLAERLNGLLDRTQDARFEAEPLDLPAAVRYLLDAEQCVQRAWQAVEREIVQQ